MRYRDLVLVMLIASAGCGQEPQAEVAGTVAGNAVRLVRSEQPAWGPTSPWVLDSRPTLDLARSGSGPAHEFFRVTDVLRLADGRIVVGDFGTLQVRCYSAAGQLLWSFGRSGEGPGDFKWITKLSRMWGDSIAVFDRSLRRVTIVSRDGELGRVVTLGGEVQRVRSVQSYDDSMFLALSSSVRTATPGSYRIPFAVVLLGRDGQTLDTLRTIGGVEGFLSNGGVDGALPMGKTGHLAVAGSDFLLGTADSLAFDRFTGPETQSQAVLVPGYDLRISGRQIDSIRNSLLHRADGRPHPPDIIDAYESVEIPDRRPGYSRLLLDEAGYVWAAQTHAPFTDERSVVWEVFSPTGDWLGRFETPKGFQVFRIGADYVLGVQLGELDVEHVQVLSLSRGH